MNKATIYVFSLLLFCACLSKSGPVKTTDTDLDSIVLENSIGFEDTTGVFIVADQMPVFPGGMHKLKNVIKANTYYPADAVNDSVQGLVLVSFIIEKDGSMSGIKILKGLTEEINMECLEVVNSFPVWTPAKEAGEPVRCRYSIPFKFQLTPTPSYKIKE